MGFDNLPPGVTPSDIPGNRPEDEQFRDYLQEVRNEHPEWDEFQVRDEAEKRMEARY